MSPQEEDKLQKRRAYQRQWKRENKDKVSKHQENYINKDPQRHKDVLKKAKAKYRLAHGDEIRAHEAEKARAKRRADPEGNKKRYLAYRIRKNASLERQAGRPRPDICELCGETPEARMGIKLCLITVTIMVILGGGFVIGATERLVRLKTALAFSRK